MRASPRPGAGNSDLLRDQDLGAAVACQYDGGGLLPVGCGEALGSCGRRRNPANQSLANGPKSGGDDVLRNEPLQSLAFRGRRVERRRPFPQSGIVFRHWTKPDVGDVVAQHHRRLEDAIAEALVAGPTAQATARGSVRRRQAEIAHRADLIGFEARPRSCSTLRSGCQCSWPLKSRSSAQTVSTGASTTDAAPNFNHRSARKSGLQRLNPAAKTLRPISSTSASSRSGAASNSALHSAKV